MRSECKGCSWLQGAEMISWLEEAILAILFTAFKYFYIQGGHLAFSSTSTPQSLQPWQSSDSKIASPNLLKTPTHQSATPVLTSITQSSPPAACHSSPQIPTPTTPVPMSIPHQQLVTVSHQIPTLAPPLPMSIHLQQLVTVSSPPSPQIWLSS